MYFRQYLVQFFEEILAESFSSIGMLSSLKSRGKVFKGFFRKQLNSLATPKAEKQWPRLGVKESSNTGSQRRLVKSCPGLTEVGSSRIS